MIAQDLEDNGEPALERVVSGDSFFQRARKTMECLEKSEGYHKRDPEKWSKDYGRAQLEFERLGGYERFARAKTILAGLGFREGQWSESLNTFSGGWRVRIELARLLLLKPEVLLLDEPSNHLDLKSVIWLEGFLKNYDGSILLISHDRHFINSLVGQIVHLDRGGLTVYKGNYDAFEKHREERELHSEKAAADQKKRIDEIRRFIERFRAKNTKATQVQSRIKQLSKMERIETTSQIKPIDFRFPQPSRFGRSAIEMVKVRKCYGDKVVYPELSLTLERGAKVALVGNNGVGKSTLMKMIAGVIKPDAGEVLLGSNVTRSYFAQNQSETLNDDLNVQDTLSEVAGSMGRTQQQSILGAFRFSGDEIKKKINILSGGERARIALAKMLVAPSSILLLDEPTNHLDICSRTVLAAALADFEGCLIVISHDRYFLDGFINRVWEVEGGCVREFLGIYSEYEWKKTKLDEETIKNDRNDPKSSVAKDKNRKRLEAEERNRRYREVGPIKKQLKGLEDRLESLLLEKDDLDKKLTKEETYLEENKSDLLKSLDRRKFLLKEESQLIDDIERLTVQLDNT